jgi:putative oxidoreductase
MLDPEALVVAGRLLIGGLFVVAGIRHFFMMPLLTGVLAARGVPAPRAALVAANCFEIVAGAALMLGVAAETAAFGLIGFTIVASVVMLNFWSLEGEARTFALSAFLTNAAIIGGLLIAAATA